METDLTRIVDAAAPVRICDNGGWTDTWFAEYGNVLSIAVQPSVRVQVTASRHRHGQSLVTFGCLASASGQGVDPVLDDPLLRAIVSAVPPPPHLKIEIST